MLKTCENEQTNSTVNPDEKKPEENLKNRSIPDILTVSEIKVEEVSIDGICGVY